MQELIKYLVFQTSDTSAYKYLIAGEENKTFQKYKIKTRANVHLSNYLLGVRKLSVEWLNILLTVNIQKMTVSMIHDAYQQAVDYLLSDDEHNESSTGKSKWFGLLDD